MKFTVSDNLILKFEKAFGLFGLGIVAWMIYRLGPGRIAQNLHSVSWGFFLMVLVVSVRFVTETLAWRLILAKEGRKIGLWKLFRTVLEGEALNYITLTRVGGEPLKALAIREKSSLTASAASVVVLKFCNLFGFWLVIAAGFLVVFFNADVEHQVKLWGGLGLAGLGVFLFSLSWIQRFGLFKPVSWLLQKIEAERDWVSTQVMKLTRLDEHIIGTYRSKPGRIAAAVLLCAIGWAEETFFIWIALYCLNMQEHWFFPILIATLSMLLSSLFFFVPWKAGTQEGTMVLTFSILNLSEPVGLSVAILRRISEIFWVFLGLALFAVETVGGSAPPAATHEA